MPSRLPSYSDVSKSLRARGIATHSNGDNNWQMVCSTGDFWTGPFSSSSVWMAKDAESWYIVTWAPVCYRIPSEADLISVCADVLSSSPTALYRIPTDLVSKYGLIELENTPSFKEHYP